MNAITLKGRIVSEVSLRESNAGDKVTDFRLMHKTRRTKNPLFIDVEVWRAEAERIYQNAARGDYVVVDGELRRDVWEKDGEERDKIKITAKHVAIERRTPTAEE